jgi:HAD superfamily hydrolase (TIGR01509 family)
MTLKAIIFDVDGTIANTEHDGHLKAFNEAFDFYELDWYWDSALYGELLSVSGGKERLSFYLNNYNPKLKWPLIESDIVNIHNKKTEIFISTISKGFISLRIGVERLINDAHNHSLKLAIATTTSFDNVKAILESTLGNDALENFAVVAAGDIVDKKKPASDIYDYVLDKMNLECSECIVIEDSEIGFQSATSAGLKTVITLNEYTYTKNFKGALVVLDHLGEDDQPFQIVNGTPTTHTLVSVDYIKELYECNR